MSLDPRRTAPGVDPRLARLATPDAPRFWAGVLFGVASAACAIGLTWASGYLISASALRPPILTLMAVIVTVRAFALGRAALRYGERMVSHDAAFRMLARLRVGVFERLIPGAPASLSRVGRGDLMSRFVSDVDDLQDLPLRVWQPLLTSLVTAAGTTVLLACISPRSALALALALLGAGVLGGLVPERAHREATERIAPARAEQSEQLLGMLDHMDVLVAYDAAEDAEAEAGRLAARQSRLDRSSATVQGLTDLALTAFAGVAVIGAIWAGGTDLQAGAFPGAWLAVLVLVPLSVFDVFEQVPTAVVAIDRVRSAASRIAEVIDAHGAADDPAAATGEHPDIPDHPGFHALELRDVTIGWPDGPAVASRIDLDLHPGETILVTGESGAGKSTLAATLVRFLDHRAGDIQLDGRDVRALGGDRVRRTIGLCEQRPHLFASTVRANLLLARPATEDADLERMLRRVGLDELVDTRDGLDTEVGEQGELLSGGQVQRLALARALLAGFPAIVFDEPTANVDPELADALLVDLLSTARQPDASGRAPAVILMSHDRVPARLVDRHLHLAGGALHEVAGAAPAID
ncbi:thiol reductant ABC exporter subunit CydC [Pseudoclavibacter caeni]|jgi:ATP-binding cassette subfamily C protein CydC|uniref:Thiol reductant ABC exporter subunit CydC n=1 Tax=Pseudoclavibacter caeni TaxID=908846 RepID=A0A7C8BTQ7_9MICO|nr:thiol reductant ABC exporter subunit CydC [Pseudoclavibacter caeni]KAB1631684.1 thiol reductant ABC exporter subunit CydC [Pseudoclavibacter caeni]NYJ97310.1 ATP-binding cassette subfamily C protein CydC [Pseudoclavibacter caeni]